ncbi:MAG: hypothetical protein IT442_10505 [Phycisphaeraceae bacterium]|nr:hypothetical protein [Phycisphaeraceae bacterium]
MSLRGTYAVVLLATALLAGNTSAGVLYLSTSATNPSPGVPEIYLWIGGPLWEDSVNLYLWFQLAEDEKVNGLAVDLVCDWPGAVQVISPVTVPNPVVYGNSRWSPGKHDGTTGSPVKLIDAMRLFALSENGINGSFGSLDSTYRVGNSYLVAQVTMAKTMLANARIWITTNDGGGISYDEGPRVIGIDPETEEPIFGVWHNPATTGFGTAGDQVDPRGSGITGRYPDAIFWAPEPTAMCLLILGGLALLRRR